MNLKIYERYPQRLELSVTNLRLHTLKPYYCDFSATLTWDRDGKIDGVTLRGVELVQPRTMDCVCGMTELLGTDWEVFREMRDAVRLNPDVRTEIAEQRRMART